MLLDALFYPKQIAVIGASKDVGSVGNEICKNLINQGYRGKLYFVNPKGGNLFGKKVLTGLTTLKGPIDLAVIAIPAALVLEEIKKLVDIRVKSIIVISAGFSETGQKEREEELGRLCKENNITIIGPNCLGVINPDASLNASFAPLMPQKGSIAFISQSGALCASVLDYAAAREMGFSKFVSIGNKVLVGEDELLEYLYKDPKTRVIAIYMEELEEADLLKKIAENVTRGKVHKPIVVLKAGRTEQGKKAAMSHTGSLGGSDQAYEALFTQTGMIRAQTIEELFDIVECFDRNKALKNDKVAVITNAGGPGVLTADALVENGMNLAKLTEETVSNLKKFLPHAASIKNPIDILGDADATRYQKTLELVLADDNVDAVEIILTPQSMTEIKKTAQDISKLKKSSKKPIVVTFMGQGLVKPGIDILNENKVATSYFPEGAASALASLNIFSKWQKAKREKPIRFNNVNAQAVRKILNGSTANGDKMLKMDDVYALLAAYGFPITKRWVIKSSDAAKKLAPLIKGPHVLRIISPQINHKSDVGGVVLGVAPQNLVSEYEKLVSHIKTAVPKAEIVGVDVSPMVTAGGLEIIIGAKTDPKLGKQILVGLGGIYAEVIKDNSWGLAPLNQYDIERMIAHLKVAKILAGYRGHKPLSVSSVADCLGRLSQLVTDFPEITEIDINPLIVMEKNVVAIDARIALVGAKIK